MTHPVPLCLNTAFDALPTYPFPRVRALLERHDPPPGDTYDLTIGAPRHAPPDFLGPVLNQNISDFDKYPPIGGSPALISAIQGWLQRRYRVSLEPKAILPLVGTREGLFMLAAIACRAHGGKRRVLMPNPLYPAYSAAALSRDAFATYLDATAETGFLPDLQAVTEEVWADTALLYLCSPSNPQGMAASPDYLHHALALARHHGFVLAVDECYGEIYGAEPPTGALEVAAQTGSFSHLVVLHSLSKRSNLPGVRSGFIAGDRDFMTAFEKLRSYGGPTMPLPLQAVSAAAWTDDRHVAVNRALYAEKFDLAERLLGISRPDGGFFLWLPVDAPEEAAISLWKNRGIRVIPGPYLASDSGKGQNPGDGYIRVALVDSVEKTKLALEQLAVGMAGNRL